MQFSRKHVVLTIVSLGVLALVVFGVPAGSFVDTALAQLGVYDSLASQDVAVVTAAGGGCTLVDSSVTPNEAIGILTNNTVAPSTLGTNSQGQIVTVDAVSTVVVDGVVFTNFDVTMPVDDQILVVLNNSTGTCEIFDVPDQG